MLVALLFVVPGCGLSVFGTQRLCDLFRQSSAQACRHRRGLDSSQAPAARDLSQEVELLHDPPHAHQASL